MGSGDKEDEDEPNDPGSYSLPVKRQRLFQPSNHLALESRVNFLGNGGTTKKGVLGNSSPFLSTSRIRRGSMIDIHRTQHTASS